MIASMQELIDLKEENGKLKDDLEYYKNMKQGIVMLLSGRQIGVSTFIDDETITYGYGKLHDHGTWQFPVPEIVYNEVQKLRDEIKKLKISVDSLL